MPFYHFRFLEENGRVVLGEDYECDNDGGAIQVAQSEMERSNYQGSEIWLGERCVGRLTVVNVNDAPKRADLSPAMTQPPSETPVKAAID